MPDFGDHGYPRTIEDAKLRGFKYFFTGIACKRGHVSRRYTSTGQCAECQYLHRSEWRIRNPEKEAASRLASVRAWCEKNPDRKRELARKSNAKPDVSANNVARAKRWTELNPEKAKANDAVGDRNRRSAKKGAAGRHTTGDIEAILVRQKFKCAECGVSVKKRENRHVDHIVPLSKGGTNWPSNLQILCPPCNLKKAAKDPLDFAKERGRLV